VSEEPMSDEDYSEFERVFDRFYWARERWCEHTGRDEHQGADGKWYGRDKDGMPILDGPHYDPAFLVWMQAQGRRDEEDLARSEVIYSDDEAVFSVPVDSP
jgi:hypothetical protein